MPHAAFDAVIIGGGLNGLCAAYQLRRRGLSRIALLERFPFGHARGSSHGKSRITRTSYGDPLYIRLALRARREEWPALERDTGRALIHDAPGLFYGTDGPFFGSYVAAVRGVPEAVEPMTPVEARARFPQFTLARAHTAFLDRTAGIVAAEETIAALLAWCRGHDVELRDQTRVTGFALDADPIRVETEGGAVLAERLVIAAGAWAETLLPFLAGRLTVVRQAVGYYRLDLPAEAHRTGIFPVWAFLDRNPNFMWYGLPEFGRPGIKVARHLTAGDPDDPDLDAGSPADAALRDLDAFVAEHFAPPVRERLGAETCLYTNTPDEHFVIDRHPENPRAVVAAGFSGHGFKFGPVTGALIADLLLGDAPTPEEFRI